MSIRGKNGAELLCLLVSGGWLATFSTANTAMAANFTAANESATGREGLAAYAAGRYEEASEMLSRALGEVGVPTLALYAARTNVKLNRWVKASELYLLASHLSARSTSNVVQLQAQYEAERERSSLLYRIPRLTILLEGADLESVEVTLDAESVPRAMLGANQLVDPGHHVVRATRDGQAVTGEVDLGEGLHKTIRLRFARRETGSASPQVLPTIATITALTPQPLVTTPGAAPQPRGDELDRLGLGPAPTTMNQLGDGKIERIDEGPTLAARANARENDSDSFRRTVGWVAVGLGGASFVLGATTGLSAWATRHDIRRSCDGDTCSEGLAHQISEYNQLRAWSTIGFVSAGILGATGLTLLLLGPNQEQSTHASVTLGPASVAMTGQF
jgi:hypothetical protein